MKKLQADPFFSTLSFQLFRLDDAFEMATCFAKLALSTFKIDSAVLVWPDSQSVEPVRRKVLGKRVSENAVKLYGARFHDHGDVFFRIDFYCVRNRKLSSGELARMRLSEKLVECAISANGSRLHQGEMARFQWMRNLSAGLSHELNTPLTTLLFHVKVLTKELPESQSVAQIKKSAAVVDQILKQHRSFSGDGEFVEFEPMSVSSMAQQMESMVHSAFPDQKEMIAFQTTGSPQQVEIQREGIELLLRHLVKNAVDSVQARQKTDSKFKPRVDVEFQLKGRNLRIKVTDNGSGIEPKNRPYIFAPYFSTKDVSAGQGQGLGLSIARGIAFLNNGTLTLNPFSQKAQFILELPLMKEEASLVNGRKAA